MQQPESTQETAKGQADTETENDSKIKKEIDRLAPRALEILEMLIQCSKKGLTAEEVRKNGVNIPRATISSYLAILTQCDPNIEKWFTTLEDA